MGKSLKKLFFDDVRKHNWPKTGKSASSVLILYRNRAGVVNSVGREPVMFAKDSSKRARCRKNLARVEDVIGVEHLFDAMHDIDHGCAL